MSTITTRIPEDPTRDAKKCIRCLIVKPLTEFQKNNQKKDGLCPYCKICENKDRRGKYHANLEHSRAYKRAQGVKHRDKRIETNKIWYLNNKDEKRIKTKEYRLSHPEMHKIAQRKYCKNNRPKRNALVNKFNSTPEGRKKVSQYNHNRKARIRGSEGKHTHLEWEALKYACNYTCLHCLKSEPEIKLTRDHIIPVSKGGSNYISNIQPLCGPCNSTKHDKII